MNPKDGTAGNAVEPAAPEAVQDADVADPGEMAEIQAEQRQLESGRYGSTEVTPFKPPEQAAGSSQNDNADDEEEEPVELKWIEIELVGEDDKPIPGERYEIEMPDGTVKKGTLDQNGWVRVEGIDPEQGTQCKISFPELDEEAWELIESVGPKEEENANAS